MIRIRYQLLCLVFFYISSSTIYYAYHLLSRICYDTDNVYLLVVLCLYSFSTVFYGLFGLYRIIVTVFVRSVYFYSYTYIFQTLYYYVYHLFSRLYDKDVFICLFLVLYLFSLWFIYITENYYDYLCVK